MNENEDRDDQDESAVAHALAEKHSFAVLAHAISARVALEDTAEHLLARLCAKLLERGDGALASELFTLYAVRTKTGAEPPADTSEDGLNPRPPSPGATEQS